MALDPRTDRRTVLEQEEEAQGRYRNEERERSEPLDPARDALRQRLERIAGTGTDVVVRRLGLAIADAEVREPALELSGAVFQLVADRGGLGGDAAEDEISDEDTGHDDQQQDQEGTDAARHPMALEQIDQLAGDRGDHTGHDQRDDDYLCQRQEPDDARDEDHDADGEPGGEPRVEERFAGVRPRLHHVGYVVPAESARQLRGELDERNLAEYLGAQLGDLDMTLHDASALLGHDIEIHVDNDGLREFFGMVRDGAESWDGSTPLRPASS